MDTKIYEARRYVAACAARIEAAKQEVKVLRDSLNDAYRRLFRLIDDEAAGVQDLPFGEADGPPVPAEAATDDPTADHEEDEPEFHGEPVDAQANGWDLVTSRPMTDDAKSEADALDRVEHQHQKAAKPKAKPKRSKARA